MTEHTPGPWTVDIPEAVCVRSEDGSRLCTINWLRGRHGLKGRIPDEEGMANARLIAAAPDLLEACKNTLMGLDLEFGPSRTDVNFPLLRAAIAKAEGCADPEGTQ